MLVILKVIVTICASVMILVAALSVTMVFLDMLFDAFDDIRDRFKK